MASAPPIARIVEDLAEQGLTQAQTAKQVRCTAAYISMLAKRYGIEFKVRGKRGRPRGGGVPSPNNAVIVPKWVPADLAGEYLDHAKLYGEEAAASHVRRLKAEASAA